MMLFVWILVFALSIFVLVKSSDYFIESSEEIGIYFHIPQFMIGLTIVAIGTSIPELLTSIVAASQGRPELIVGNIVGSNITNILLIIGMSSLVAGKIVLHHYNDLVDEFVFIGSVIVFAIAAWDSIFTWIEGAMLLIIYLIYLFHLMRKHRQEEVELAKLEVPKTKKPSYTTVAMFLLSILFLYFSARYSVESLIHISAALNIGSEVIAATALALGTSLPELIVTITAVTKHKENIAVGNIIGSNIFNILGIMFVGSLFGSIAIPATILTFALPLMIISTIIFFMIVQKRKILRWHGILLVCMYVLFLARIMELI